MNQEMYNLKQNYICPIPVIASFEAVKQSSSKLYSHSVYVTGSPRRNAPRDDGERELNRNQ